MSAKKIEPMAHRIITNGEVFRVETRDAGTEVWDLECQRVLTFKGFDAVPVDFSSYKKAAAFVEREYGERANLMPRPFHPA
jgi:hypothetical protein